MMEAFWLGTLSFFSLEYSEGSQMAGYCSGLVHFVHLSFEVSERRCPSVMPFLVAGDAGSKVRIFWSVLDDY